MTGGDHARIQHMLEAAQSAAGFCEGLNFADFCRDERTWRAVVQCIEVIGEAGRHVTEATRQAIPDVPWRQIIGMRHRVTHAYFEIDLKLVWEVVAKDLDPLIAALKSWDPGQP